MQLKLIAPIAPGRYQLTILSYPSEECLSEICELIYDSKDKNLIRSLSALPYVIGRSFPTVEVQRLNQALTELKVGHEFKNLAGEGEIISFNPPTEESVSKTKLRSTVLTPEPIGSPKMNSKGLILWLTLGLVSAIGISYYLKWSGSRTTTKEVSTQKQTVDDRQATIEELTKDVEFRKHKDFLWQKAMRDLGLVEEDALRTYDNSAAVLRYREGSRVFIRANTLMIIGREAAPDSRNIRLEDGALQARLKPSANQTRLAIETQVGTLELKSPKLGEQAKEARIETKMNKGTLLVKVAEGSAVLKPSSPSAPPVEIKSREEVAATPTSITAPTPFEPSIELTAPAENETLKINPQGENRLTFKWENLGENLTYTFEIASDAEMKNILLKQNVQEPQLVLQYLDPGPVFWRITATVEGTLYKSAAQKLYVQENHN